MKLGSSWCTSLNSTSIYNKTHKYYKISGMKVMMAKVILKSGCVDIDERGSEGGFGGDSGTARLVDRACATE